MASILKKHERYWSEIAVFGDYLPWGVHKDNGGDGSNYPAHSGRILDLKDKKQPAIEHFKKMIEPELADEIAIAVVPSHDPANLDSGIRTLAATLAATGKRIDASGALIRKHKIEKLAHGGDRSEDIHTRSVVVAKPELIKGRDVLLLDDVTKTGNSLSACRKLLIAAGANSVQCATIGKT